MWLESSSAKRQQMSSHSWLVQWWSSNTTTKWAAASLFHSRSALMLLLSFSLMIKHLSFIHEAQCKVSKAFTTLMQLPCSVMFWANNVMLCDVSCLFWCWFMFKLFSKMIGTEVKGLFISKASSSFVIVLRWQPWWLSVNLFGPVGCQRWRQWSARCIGWLMLIVPKDWWLMLIVLNDWWTSRWCMPWISWTSAWCRPWLLWPSAELAWPSAWCRPRLLHQRLTRETHTMSCKCSRSC